MDDKRQEPSGGAQAARPLGAEPTQELRGWGVVSFGGAPPRSEGGGSLTVFFTILVALVGGPLAIWHVITAHVQALAARHQAAIAREAHYTDLFTRAIEQLGATRDVTRHIEEVKSPVEASDEKKGDSDTPPDKLITETEPNLKVRLGAIHALDRIARDSERDHWPIMQVLSSYIRNPQNLGKRTQTPDEATTLNVLRVDVQAALTVIAGRLPERIAFEANRGLHLDLSEAPLKRASLSGAHLENANFSGAHLEGAHLSWAHLEDANLSGAHLEGTNLGGAHRSLD